MVRNGEFIAGARPTIADCALAALIGFAKDFYNVPIPSEWGRILGWYARFSARSSAAPPHVEAAEESLVKTRVLAEVVGAQDNVEPAGLDRVVEAIGQVAGVARHPGEANLTLPLRRVDELVPLGILKTRHLVDRVIEIHVYMVGLEAAQTAFERLHDLVPLGVGPRGNLRGEKNLVALPLQYVAEHDLRIAAPVQRKTAGTTLLKESWHRGAPGMGPRRPFSAVPCRAAR